MNNFGDNTHSRRYGCKGWRILTGNKPYVVWSRVTIWEELSTEVSCTELTLRNLTRSVWTSELVSVITRIDNLWKLPSIQLSWREKSLQCSIADAKSIPWDITSSLIFCSAWRDSGSNGSQESCQSGRKCFPRTCDSRRRTCVRGGSHLCVIQWYLCPRDRSVWERNALPCYWRHESQGWQRWEQSLCCYACCSGRRSSLQGNTNFLSSAESILLVWVRLMVVLEGLVIGSLATRKYSMKQPKPSGMLSIRVEVFWESLHSTWYIGDRLLS